ncbi:MAG: DUF3575 domain-containing protein [Owenweeksia sp.]
MRNLKLSAILLVAFTCVSLKSNAQHEVKTNVLGLLFNQFGLTYEYVLDENMGILGSVAYFTPPSSFSYDYTAISFTPEFRYYLNPDDDAEGYFVGGYLKYRNTSTDEYPGIDTSGFGFTNVTQTTNGVALGITTGRKWVTRSGFMFETFVGFGRYLFVSETYSDDYEPGEFENAVDDLPAWDFRLGASVGWRFDN